MATGQQKNRPKPSKRRVDGRTQIYRFARMLGVDVVSLEWTPICAGGEMQGPGGGWECVFRERHGDEMEAVGLNADELCQSMILSMRMHDMDRYQRACYRLGVRNAAKEKDAEIERLSLALATGSAPCVTRSVNEIKRAALREFMKALWQTQYGGPPMRSNWIMQELLSRHLGEDWNQDTWEVPAEPVRFEPLPENERARYRDSSPWNDLAAIRNAAGTEDTSAIVAMLATRQPTG